MPADEIIEQEWHGYQPGETVMARNWRGRDHWLTATFRGTLEGDAVIEVMPGMGFRVDDPIDLRHFRESDIKASVEPTVTQKMLEAGVAKLFELSLISLDGPVLGYRDRCDLARRVYQAMLEAK